MLLRTPRLFSNGDRSRPSTAGALLAPVHAEGKRTYQTQPALNPAPTLIGGAQAPM